MDWTATILAAAGGKANPDFPFDGIDLIPLCQGKKPEADRTFYWRTFQHSKQKAMRDGKWKYLQDEQAEYLFDLKTDPGETKDLKGTNADIFQRLKRKYAEWERTMLKPFPLGP
jgi:arylsulfatase A-like enzyme